MKRQNLDLCSYLVCASISDEVKNLSTVAQSFTVAERDKQRQKIVYQREATKE
jgi:hypothetical protein